jgi:hypothetical protein
MRVLYRMLQRRQTILKETAEKRTLYWKNEEIIFFNSIEGYMLH